MAFGAQFKALLKKNFILWYRNMCGSVCEILLPVILIFIIVIVRKLVPTESIAAQSYVSRAGLAYYMEDTLKFGHNYSLDANPYKMGLYPGTPFLSCLYFKRPYIVFVGQHALYDRLKADLFSSSGCNSPYLFLSSLLRVPLFLPSQILRQ